MLSNRAVSRRRALRLAAGWGAWLAAAPPVCAATPAAIPAAIPAATPAAFELAPRVFEEYVWSLHLPQAEAALLHLAYYGARLRAANSVEQLKRLPAQLAVTAFDELYAVIFYTADQRVLRHLVKVFGLLSQRREATQSHLQRTYNACYYCRRLDVASDLVRQFPGRLKAAPDIRMSAGTGTATPAVMHLATGCGELFAAAYPMPEKPTILMITNPGCHFSQDAFRAISADPALMRRLDGPLQLLAPHQMDVDIDDFVQWNRLHPSLPMSLAYHWRGWSMLDMRETPTFYFIKEGAVQHALKGWPNGTAKIHLRDGLAKIGL